MSNKKAFTMIESVISIFILSLVVTLVISVRPFYKTINNDNNENVINYQLFLKELESDKFKFIWKKIDRETIYLYSLTNKKDYKIKMKNHSIILSGEKSGYLPLLDKVNKINFLKYGNHLKINITFINGEKYTNVSVLRDDK